MPDGLDGDAGGRRVSLSLGGVHSRSGPKSNLSVIVTDSPSYKEGARAEQRRPVPKQVLRSDPLYQETLLEC